MQPTSTAFKIMLHARLLKSATKSKLGIELETANIEKHWLYSCLHYFVIKNENGNKINVSQYWLFPIRFKTWQIAQTICLKPSPSFAMQGSHCLGSLTPLSLVEFYVGIPIYWRICKKSRVVEAHEISGYLIADHTAHTFI